MYVVMFSVAIADLCNIARSVFFQVKALARVLFVHYPLGVWGVPYSTGSGAVFPDVGQRSVWKPRRQKNEQGSGTEAGAP